MNSRHVVRALYAVRYIWVNFEARTKSTDTQLHRHGIESREDRTEHLRPRHADNGSFNRGGQSGGRWLVLFGHPILIT